MRTLTELSLMDQMRITSREIERRKELFGITEEDSQCLKELASGIEASMEEIIDEFYGHQTRMPEISLIIGDSETLRRLKLSMRGYLRELFSGLYDENYVEGRLRVGKVHKRIGVTPKLYMSAMSQLQQVLERYIDLQSDADRGKVQKDAVHKILLFDSQLVFETYISSLMAEIEAAKLEVEQYASGLEERVQERTRQLETLSKTDPLTGLLNQRGLWDILRRDIALARRNHSLFSVLYFDLNNFKRANDELGHQTGDKILCQVASAILACIREVDAACRYGGDEYCIVLPGLELLDTDKIVRRLIEALKKMDAAAITFSFGAVQWGEQQMADGQAMVDIADKRMYQAKEQAHAQPGNWLCRGDKPYRIEAGSPPPPPPPQEGKIVPLKTIKPGGK